MLKLTQCLIVKNEEHNLPRALGWGKSLFAEQIVVDTGSTDGTVVLANKLGAVVHSFAWMDDFAAARNFAVSKCSGDWIVFLDADEYFEAEDAAGLRALIEKVAQLHRKEGVRARAYNVIELPWVNWSNHGKEIGRQSRIFRNTRQVQYVGAVHEHLQAMPNGYLKVYAQQNTPAICHMGYVWSAENSKAAKGARNFAAAQKAIEQTPESAKMWLFAAEALLLQGAYEQAEQYFMQAMSNRDGSIWEERLREGYQQWMKLYLRMGKPTAEMPHILERALRVYAEASHRFPDDPDFDVLMSLLCFQAKDLKHTIQFFRASLQKNNGKMSTGLMTSHREAYEKLRAICESLEKRNLL